VAFNSNGPAMSACKWNKQIAVEKIEIARQIEKCNKQNVR